MLVESMKKLLTICLSLLLIALLLASPALAQGLERALPLINLSAFDAYAAFTHDEDSGEWSLRSNEAEALLRSVREGAMRSYTSSGCVVFYVQIEGNARTGLFAPYLYMEYAGPRLNATAVSFRVGDMRYDLPVYTEMPEGAETERLIALLGADELQMLAKFGTADTVTVRLHGDDSYTSEIKRKKSYANTRERVQAASLDCVDLSAELDALGFGEVLMQSELREAWYEKTNVRAQFEATNLADEILPSGSGVPTLDKQMKMLSTEHSNKNVKLLEDKLVEINYLTGTANNTYGTSTKQAVEDIQRLNGLVPTGSADGRILNILFGDEKPRAEEAAEAEWAELEEASGAVEAEAGVEYLVRKNAQMKLNRYWFANTVKSRKPVSAMSEYSCANRDNLLLIVDGAMMNLMATDMSFNRTITAKAVYNDEYTYDMIVKCESDGGERFDTQLLPLGTSRVVLMAEVPKQAAVYDAGWTIEIGIGGATLTYQLQ